MKLAVFGTKETVLNRGVCNSESFHLFVWNIKITAQFNKGLFTWRWGNLHM